MDQLLDTLRYANYRLWSTGTGLVVLLFLIAGIGFFGFQTESRKIAQRKGTLTQATITAAGFGRLKNGTGKIFISARDPDGIVISAWFEPYDVAGCKVGDTIKAWRNGVALTLGTRPCSEGEKPNRLEKVG